MTWQRQLRLWMGRAGECRNPGILTSALAHSRRRSRMLAFATGRRRRETDGYIEEIEDDTAFLTEVRDALARWTSYTPRAVDFVLVRGWGSVFFNEVALYALVRALRPAVVVETGGTPGKSTAFILRALERNTAGHLHTVDQPPPSAGHTVGRQAWHDRLPAGLESTWAVPRRLRARHTLRLGRSQDVLADLLAQLGPIDMFFHDSDHSSENMHREFVAAWPHLRAGGLLVADDVLANDAFFAFCAARAVRYARVDNLAVAPVPGSTPKLTRLHRRDVPGPGAPGAGSRG